MIENIQEVKFLGIKLINSGDFFELLLRLLLNSFVVYLISNRMYLKSNQNYQFYFSYNTIAVVTFLMCFLLNSVKLELGFALGLFALFTMIRFRTGTIPVKEMTYLFVVIGVAVINALANKKVSYLELLFANSAIVFAVNYFEKISPRIKAKKGETVSVTLQKFDQFSASSLSSKTTQLEELISKPITHFKIKKVNQLNNTAELTIYTKSVG
tara:strand:+ start:2268 stop:2903 length:636 start_codon:yes stop_codon:yes gene_type:complete